MPIKNYEGNTFVAFLDISGFKELMRNEKEALKALDKLYQYGYEILKDQSNECRVEGIFVSDSGMLFVRRNNQILGNNSESLRSLLIKIKMINERMIESDFMLTTSIAYGKFKYKEKIEFEGMEKNQIYGYAYLSAFLDNEKGKPKIQPGQCRIVSKNLPDDVKAAIDNIDKRNDLDEEVFKMIKKINKDDHYYYYWMAKNKDDIERIKNAYKSAQDTLKDAYKSAEKLAYSKILEALKGNSN